MMGAISGARPRTRLSGAGIDAPGGRRVAISPRGEATPVGPIWQTPFGAAFGPLELQPRKETTVVLDELSFRATEAGIIEQIRSFKLSSLFATASLAGLAASSSGDGPHENIDGEPSGLQESVTRRDVLMMGGAALGLGAATRPASASDAQSVLEIATFSITSNPGGMRVQIADSVADVLPQLNDYYLTIGGQRIASFAGSRGGGVVPAGITGEVRVDTIGDESFWKRLAAFFSTEEASFTFPLPSAASSGAVVLSDDPIVAETVRYAGASDLIVQIGETSITHRSEVDADERSAVGMYYLNSAGELVYQTGRNTPAGDVVTLRAHVGRVDEIRDDVGRRVASAW